MNWEAVIIYILRGELIQFIASEFYNLFCENLFIGSVKI